MNLKKQAGFSLIEIIIVALVLAIIGVLALPQVISSNRLWKFVGFQKQVGILLQEARQEAISQRTVITFQYDDSAKKIILYGGNYGDKGDSHNRIYLVTDGKSADEFVYGSITEKAPPALADGTNLLGLTNQMGEIHFQADGFATDSANNPKSGALYFYHAKAPVDTAFAVSVLGAGGRSKIWRFNKVTNIYGE